MNYSLETKSTMLVLFFQGKAWCDWAMFDFTEDVDIISRKKKERAANEKARQHLNEIKRRTGEDSDTAISDCDDEDSCEDSCENEGESTTETDVQPVTCIVPARMSCFVDLTDIAPSSCESHIKPGVYDLVEKAVVVEDSWMSQLLIPYTKNNTLELANIRNIVAPVCMMPNTGNEDKQRYLMVTQRRCWLDLFDDWLPSPH
jgi:hypothetical protein